MGRVGRERGGGKLCTVRSKFNKFEYVGGGGARAGLGQRPCTEGAEALYRDPPVDRMTDGKTRLKTLPSRNFIGE